MANNLSLLASCRYDYNSQNTIVCTTGCGILEAVVQHICNVPMCMSVYVSVCLCITLSQLLASPNQLGYTQKWKESHCVSLFLPATTDNATRTTATEKASCMVWGLRRVSGGENENKGSLWGIIIATNSLKRVQGRKNSRGLNIKARN